MSSTMKTILEYIAAQLVLYPFKTVGIGTSFDTAHKLPSCLVIPRDEKAELLAPLSSRMVYQVELQMRFAAHDQGELMDAALETLETIIAQFTHYIIPPIPGHIETTTEVLELQKRDDTDNHELWSPTVLLSFTVLQEA